MVCCFTGHRELPAVGAIAEHTKERIRALINDGVTEFISGGAVGYDLLAAELCLAEKASSPEIRLVIAVPCPEQDRYYSEENQRRYRAVLSRADEVVLVSEHYFNGCMQVRDRYMVDRADVVVAYCTKTTGGTYYTARYAEKKEKTVYYIESGERE